MDSELKSLQEEMATEAFRLAETVSQPGFRVADVEQHIDKLGELLTQIEDVTAEVPSPR